jgi:hypothetical protein
MPLGAPLAEEYHEIKPRGAAMKIKSALAVIAALFLFSPVFAADRNINRNIDVSVVLDLLDAGVSDRAIERYVEKNEFAFDLSSRDLKDLKKAGASDDLIEFLQGREDDEYGDAEEYGQEYGVSSYPPSYYSYGLYYGYPYYYSGLYYPYYYPYYYGPSFNYSYRYPYYGGRRSSGSGVVSHWYRNRSGGSTGTTTRSSPSRGSSSHRGSSSQRGGGGGRRR